MALSQPTILAYARDRIYSSGLGEKPSIRKTTGIGGWSSSGGLLYTITLDSGEGTKVKPGHVVSSRGATSLSNAYAAQVISVSTDTIECAAEQGTPSGVPEVLEHGAPVSEYSIYLAIEDIVNSYLFPHVYDIATDTFTPDLAYGQSAANASDEEVLRAWQEIGGSQRQIPITLTKNLDTTQFASGKMFSYQAYTGADVAVSTVRRVTLADSTSSRLEQLIAKGAAAMVVEGAEASSNWEYAKNDARERGQGASRSLWSAFFTERQLIADDLSRNRVTEYVVSR